MQDRNVNYQFKILYAFAMIMIVCNHASGGGLQLLFNWFPIEVSSVEIFVFGSGYFYSEANESRIGCFIKNKIKKLIIPLYLWNVFYGVFTTLISFAGFNLGMKITMNTLFVQPIINGHQFDFNMASWFVAPLFFAELIYLLIRKIVTRINKSFLSETILLIFLFFVGLMGLYVASIRVEGLMMLLLERTAFFIPFYGLGYYYKKFLEARDLVSNVAYFAGLFAITSIILFIYGHIPGAAPSSMQFYEDGLVIPFITAILGIAFYLRLAKILEPVIGHSKWVNSIANNSFSIMVNQFLGFMIINGIYGLLWAKMGLFTDFDIDLFKNYIFYAYTPRGIDNYKLIFVIAGIVVPIYMQKGINLVKGRLLKNA